jgi:hypothetical protein
MYSPQEFAGQLSSYAAEAEEYGPYRGRVRNRIKGSCDCGEWCISTCNQHARRDGAAGLAAGVASGPLQQPGTMDSPDSHPSMIASNS